MSHFYHFIDWSILTVVMQIAFKAPSQFAPLFQKVCVRLKYKGCVSNFSCNEPGLGPLMRDVKNKICTGESIFIAFSFFEFFGDVSDM